MTSGHDFPPGLCFPGEAPLLLNLMSERTAKKRARPARPSSSQPTQTPAPEVSPLALLEAMPGAFLALDGTWSVSYVSPAMRELLGKASPLNQDFREAGVALEWLKSHLRLERSVASQKPATFEHTWEERAATYEVRVQPFAGGLLVHLRDVTEERRTREELQRQADRLRLCMESAHIVTWDWDLRDGLLRWSDNVSDVLRLPVSKLEGTYDEVLARVLPEDRPLVQKRVAKAFKERDALDVEFRLERPDGEHPWLRARGRVQLEQRKVVRLTGVLMDVTFEKLAAEEARLHTEFQEQLVGIVSHDIRSPLGAIINWSRVLASDGASAEDPKRTSRRITAAAVRIERLTRLLLDFTRARLGGGISIEPRKMDLHELFDKVAHEFRVAFPTRTVQCEREGDARGLWDPDRLGQVLSNLVENALKYSPEDSSVRLSTRGDKEHVILEVHNRGKPISPETLPHLFEPFRRGPQTTRTLKVSYGLGLYIVREIVRAHGGTIDVRSSEKEGTSIRVRLPRLPPGAHPGAPPAPATTLN
jgi:signal transduction histidine kinase